MDKRKLAASLCLAFSMTACVSAQRAMTPGQRADETRALNAVLDQFEQGYLEQNADKVMAPMATDNDMVNIGTDDGEVFTGAMTLRDSVQKGLAGPDKVTKMSITDRRFWFSRDGNGAWAYTSVSFDLISSGNPVTVKGARYTMTAEKRDGRWVVVQSHMSVGVPSAAPDGAAVKAPASAQPR